MAAFVSDVGYKFELNFEFETIYLTLFSLGLSFHDKKCLAFRNLAQVSQVWSFFIHARCLAQVPQGHPFFIPNFGELLDRVSLF